MGNKVKPTPEKPQTWFCISTLSLEFIAVTVVEASSSYLVMVDSSGQTIRTTRSTQYHFYVDDYTRALQYCRENLERRIVEYKEDIDRMKTTLAEHELAWQKLASDGGTLGVQVGLFG